MPGSAEQRSPPRSPLSMRRRLPSASSFKPPSTTKLPSIRPYPAKGAKTSPMSLSTADLNTSTKSAGHSVVRSRSATDTHDHRARARARARAASHTPSPPTMQHLDRPPLSFHSSNSSGHGTSRRQRQAHGLSHSASTSPAQRKKHVPMRSMAHQGSFSASSSRTVSPRIMNERAMSPQANGRTSPSFPPLVLPSSSPQVKRRCHPFVQPKRHKPAPKRRMADRNSPLLAHPVASNQQQSRHLGRSTEQSLTQSQREVVVHVSDEDSTDTYQSQQTPQYEHPHPTTATAPSDVAANGVATEPDDALDREDSPPPEIVGAVEVVPAPTGFLCGASLFKRRNKHSSKPKRSSGAQRELQASPFSNGDDAKSEKEEAKRKKGSKKEKACPSPDLATSSATESSSSFARGPDTLPLGDQDGSTSSNPASKTKALSRRRRESFYTPSLEISENDLHQYRNKCATRIQAAWRGFIARVRFEQRYGRLFSHPKRPNYAMKSKEQLRLDAIPNAMFMPGKVVPEEAILSEFLLLEKLGTGNFADVVKCQNKHTNAISAMKIVPKFKVYAPLQRRLMKTEIELLQSVSHPNIIDLQQALETRTHVYLLLDYIQHGDLFDMIVNSDFSEVQIKYVMADIGEALQYLHSKSITHRDIKPENIMCQQIAPDAAQPSHASNHGPMSTGEYAVSGLSSNAPPHNPAERRYVMKLVDFGLAHRITGNINEVCGSPTYMAPEIALREPNGYNIECDLWSLGVVMFVMVTGVPPFNIPMNYQDVSETHYSAPLFEDEVAWKPISEQGRYLIISLLQRDPRKRMTAQRLLRHKWFRERRHPSQASQQGSLSSMQSTLRLSHDWILRHNSRSRNLSHTTSFTGTRRGLRRNSFSNTLVGKRILAAEGMLPVHEEEGQDDASEVSSQGTTLESSTSIASLLCRSDKDDQQQQQQRHQHVQKLAQTSKLKKIKSALTRRNSVKYVANTALIDGETPSTAALLQYQQEEGEEDVESDGAGTGRRREANDSKARDRGNAQGKAKEAKPSAHLDVDLAATQSLINLSCTSQIAHVLDQLRELDESGEFAMYEEDVYGVDGAPEAAEENGQQGLVGDPEDEEVSGFFQSSADGMIVYY